MSGRVLITGAGGMLARHLIPKLCAGGFETHLTELSAVERCGLTASVLDITKLELVVDAAESLRPDWIINCAAYTAVDKAEAERELCFRVNATGVRNLALAARESGARLLHISTDYVFGGPLAWIEAQPIRESAETNPCGIYGLSKECGEELALAVLPEDACILRTSWLHGVQEPNFISAILRLLRERDELKVVDDQIGSPTWAEWLADVMLKMVLRDARGMFHACSNGGISWYDFACEIASQVKSTKKISPQTTRELNRPAPRPAYSVLDTTKLEEFLGEPCPDWKQGVYEHLKWIEAV